MLRYACFVRGDDGTLRVDRLREAPLPPDAFHPGQLGGPLKSPAEMTALVQSLVEGAENPVTEASLVLPDAWYRLVFAELDSLPSASEARLEALRWKLKRLVPFRVDDLRLDAVSATALAQQEEPERVMIAFAIDLLVEGLEEAFEAAGIQLGAVRNVSMAMANLVDPLADEALDVLVLPGDQEYSLLASMGDSPVLYRYKQLEGVGDEVASGRLILREMKLTAAFLREQLGDRSLERVVVLGDGRWPALVAEALDCQPQVLSENALGSWPVQASELSLQQRAALYGAALQEVA